VPDERPLQPDRFISLRWVVPAISAVVLTLVVALFGTIAYRAVRQGTLKATADRLVTAAEAFSQPAVAGPAWVRQSRTMAANAAIVDALASGGQRRTDEARALLRVMAPDTGQTLAVDVRDVSGATLLSVVSAIADSVQLAMTGGRGDQPVVRDVGEGSAPARLLADSLRLARAYTDTAAMSELYARGGQVLYERAVPIVADGKVTGHLVEVRRVAASANALRQIARLIGNDAALVVGNADGSLWTDLTKPIDHPGPSNGPRTYERDGRRWIGVTAPLPTAQWVVGVEVPEDRVLAPLRALRWRFVIIGAVIVALAILISERLSRSLTTPLTRLTTAAEGIASGDRGMRTVVFPRPDEIGRLSRAFATMAQSIRASHDTLEHSIGARTAELSEALERLRDAQDELLRKERLATLGQLSSSIAHELRNPLGVMTNALYYLDSVLADAPPKVRDHIGRLRNQVRLSESIITGLLDFTRTSVAQPKVVPLRQLIDEQLARVEAPTGVHVERNLPPDLPDLVVDPVQVGQVLFNLLTNAVQAMEAGGGTLTLRARRHGDRVRIDVADTGPGIPAEQLEKIFEPLFTTKARGIGLGLSVSRTLVTANGGTLTASNQPGGGAVLSMELPVAQLHRDPAGGPRADVGTRTRAEVV
jgi:signal transduction histidine kinase